MAQVLNGVSCAICLILHIIIYIPYYIYGTSPGPSEGGEAFSLFASYSSLLTPNPSLLTPHSKKKFPENLVVRKKLLTFAFAYEK